MKLQVDVTTNLGAFVASNIVSSEAEAGDWLKLFYRNGILPLDYVVKTTDVTQIYADHDLIEMGIAAQHVGDRCIALAYAINAQKQVSPLKLNMMMTDPTLAFAERLLRNGALMTGKLLLQSVSRDYFTEAEIKRVTDLIDKSGLI